MLLPKPGAKHDGSLTVHIPAPSEDRPSWVKVAVIAALGFAIGVAWPHLAGVRLGPSAPGTPSNEGVPSGAPAVGAPSPGNPGLAPASPASPAAPVAPSASSAPLVSAVAAVPVAPSGETPSLSSLSVGHGFVFSCKDSGGDSLKATECGKLPLLDGVVMPRLRKLADCPAASTVSGKVHFVLRVEFARGGALTIDFGRSQGPDAPDALLACARASLAGASALGIAHDHPTYAVAYTVAFGASGLLPTAPSAHSGASTPDDGSSQVVWDVALVRDAPKTGKVVARLQRGAPLRLGSSKDGWYPVKYGDGFTNDGWVYRGAIGR